MDLSAYFGEWILHEAELRQQFLSSQPFEHVVIPNFFTPALADAVHNEFPDPLNTSHDWKHYDNPIEQKFALNDFANLPLATAAFALFQNETFVRLIRSISGLPTLEPDPHLHGAGLHAYPCQGKLDMHLDYSIHPLSGKERRLNLIVYLNKGWKQEYGGDLQLASDLSLPHVQVVTPVWNTAVLFRTSDLSYHGIPRPIQCPPDEYRKSLAVYYLSDARENALSRLKAEFFPLPKQQVDARLKRLYEIRKTRIITQADLADWPDWRHEGDGHW